jgi:hypothetical protein
VVMGWSEIWAVSGSIPMLSDHAVVEASIGCCLTFETLFCFMSPICFS